MIVCHVMSGVLPSVGRDQAPGMQHRVARRRALRFGLVILGLLLALLVAESGLRLVKPASAWVRLPFSYDLRALALARAGQSYVRFDADLGWTTTPDYRGQLRSGDYQNNH